jgi:hypothetical protein
MSAGPAPGRLALAIERAEWEVAALYLLLGVTRAARALPPEAVEAMIELLAGDAERPRRRGHHERRERR